MVPSDLHTVLIYQADLSAKLILFEGRTNDARGHRSLVLSELDLNGTGAIDKSSLVRLE